MNASLVSLTYEIEPQPGEKLSLPQTLIESVGPGRWLVTVQPLGRTASSPPLRRHAAFLSSYAREDERLYDDYPPR